jgi:uncharacterized protein (DUF1697 family)
LRSVPYLADLVAADPFACVVDASVYEYCVTFLHPAAHVPATLPLRTTRNWNTVRRLVLKHA